MSASDKRTELFVGLFVFFGLAIMAALILQFGRFEDGFKEKYPLHITFPDATGVFKGVDVLLSGVKVGTVAAKPRPNPSFNGVIVDLEIFEEFKIPRNTIFSIRTRGVMGDNYIGIEIDPNGEEGEFRNAGEVVAGKPAADLQGLALEAEDISEKAQTLLGEVTKTMQEIRSGLDNLNSALNKLDNDIMGDENLDNVKAAFANLRKTSETLRESSTKLGPVLDEAKTAVSSATATFESTQKVIERLEPVVAEFEETAEGVTLAVERINHGDGLLNALLNDPELKENFLALVTNLRIHGVLRYKDTGGEGESGEGSESSNEGSERKPRFFYKR